MSDVTPTSDGRAPQGAPAFPGVIGVTLEESTPAWPAPVRPTGDAPDVVMVVLDDVGFAQLGCYGSDIETPTFDGLAAGGLRYTQFHTTALCSPTRSCLLTGRNHHANGMGALPEMAAGFPGYNAMIPRENGLLSEMLRDAGYGTLAVGKWHVTPDEEMTMAGPFDRWPLGRGFERFYGWLGGGCHQWQPGALVQDNHFVDPPPEREGYHVSEDLVDQAIGYVRDLHSAAADKPFFLYLAFGACHAPHHVPAQEVERYCGRFDGGWDRAREDILARQKALGIFPDDLELPERNPGVEAWEDLSPERRRLFARMQETYAAFMTHTDRQVGRLVEFLDRIGRLDNTLFIVISDNGASAEGGPDGAVDEYAEYNGVTTRLEDNLAAIERLGDASTWNHYPLGWAMAGNTPFRLWKRYIYQGGIADPCIMHWPAGIEMRGGLRSQYHHCVDIVPTVLEAAGVSVPERIAGVAQSPVEGVSMVYSFADGKAATRKDVQYYEMLGCRAIWSGGWKAVAQHEPLSGTGRFDEDVWSLYHVAQDPTETRDLADEHPKRLSELVTLWWREAWRCNVLPLDDRGWQRFEDPRPRLPERGRVAYLPDAAPLFQRGAADVVNRSFSITADVTVPESGAEGVLLAHGSRFGGMSLYIKDGQLAYVYKVAGLPEWNLAARIALAPGMATLGMRFRRTGDHRGEVQLLADGRELARREIAKTATIFPVDSGLTAGRDRGLTVTDAYRAPFRFTGELHRVTVTLDGPPTQRDDRAVDAQMSLQ